MEEQSLSIKPSLVVCTECSGVMRYKGAGTYVCEKCGHEEMNDYGIVRQFLEKRGPSNVFEISAGTGLSRSVIVGLLKEGRLEVAKSSTTGLVCMRCGLQIRHGEYCSRCQAELDSMESRNRKKGIYNALMEERGDGKMRFLSEDDKKPNS